MARIIAILSALFTAFRRDAATLGSLAGNNFFFMSLVFLQRNGTFVYLLGGLVMLFPLCTDPLRKIPPVRLGLWPLEVRERWMLRLASPWLNPLTWILAALAVWVAREAVSVGLWLVMAAVFAVGFAAASLPAGLRRNTWRRVPNFPGPLNHLIRKNLREILSTLDFYCGLILSLSFLIARLARLPLPPQAFVAGTVLIALSLSSFAQCLFGLDSDQALTRYRLLPIRGWQILCAKGAAFLLVGFALALPLAPLPGLGAALAALAVGHAPSVSQPREQIRWRFTSGGAFGNGVLQVAFMALAAGTVYSHPLLLVLPVGAYAGSVWWYGAALDRNPL